MQNVSGFGLSINILASNTFPSGFNVSQFSDDSDPLDLPEYTVGDASSGLNGDLLVWNKASGIHVSISVIPGGVDDTNLEALLDANSVGLNKQSAKDEISWVITYPDNTRASCGPGIITTGPISKAVASSGRLKTRTYHFVFESISKTKV